MLFKSPVELSPEIQPDGIPSEQKANRYINAAYNGEMVKFEWMHKKPDGTLFETEVTLNNIYLGIVKRRIIGISGILLAARMIHNQGSWVGNIYVLSPSKKNQ